MKSPRARRRSAAQHAKFAATLAKKKNLEVPVASVDYSLKAQQSAIDIYAIKARARREGMIDAIAVILHEIRAI